MLDIGAIPQRTRPDDAINRLHTALRLLRPSEGDVRAPARASLGVHHPRRHRPVHGHLPPRTQLRQQMQV